MEQSYWDRVPLSRRRLFRGAAVGSAGLAAAALIGCSSSGESTPGGGGGSGATTAPGGTAQQRREAGSVINVGAAPQYSARFPEKSAYLSDYNWSKHPDRLNPQIPQYGGVWESWFNDSGEHNWVSTGNQGTAAMAALAANMVLAIKYGPFADNDFLELTTDDALASNWEQPDDQTYIFTFKQNVKWQNVPPVNGRAFTADDAKFAWEVLRDDPKSAQSAVFQDVESIEVVDDHTMRVKMSQPFAAFLKGIAAPYCSIFSREQWDGPDSLSKVTIGTGPFIQRDIDPASGDVYVRNPDYFEKDELGNQLPFLDGFHSAKIADNQSAQAAFVSKQLDAIVHFQISTVEDVERMRSQVPDAGLQIWPPNGTLLYLLNINEKGNPLLQDVRVRQALSMGMDRVNTFIDTLFRGSATTAGYLVHTYLGSRFPFTPDQLGQYFQYKPDEARKLLEAAGVTLPLKLEVLNSSSTRAAFVEAVQPDYREAGVELDLNTVESIAATNAYFNREWKDLHTWSQLSVHGNDMDGWAYERYHSQSPQNAGAYSNAQVDDLAVKQRRTFVEEERRDLWRQEHDILLQDIPLLVAGGSFEPVMWQSYVHEFTDNFVSWALSWGATQFARVWFDANAPKRSVRQLTDDPGGYVRRHFNGVRMAG